MTFTELELEYLATQRLGRLATIAPVGFPQNNPVGFRANVQANPKVSFVVDDILSLQPWQVRGVEVRGVEVRGEAETLTDQEPPMPGFSRELIRLHPRRIRSWGLDPRQPFGGSGRTVR